MNLENREFSREWQEQSVRSPEADVLFPAVYQELKRIAGQWLDEERSGHTLQPTALVHETYIRLHGVDGGKIGDLQFLALASRAMRRILIDYARKKKSLKRGGERRETFLDDAIEPGLDRDESLLELDCAMDRLEALDPQLHQVVELKFFGGCNAEQIAGLMNVSTVTIHRWWKLARGWLHRELSEP